jgi:hypothetical protein
MLTDDQIHAFVRDGFVKLEAAFPRVDVSFGTEDPDFLSWRANVASKGRALLMLFLISDVGEDDAPTRIRVGSHRDVARTLPWKLMAHGQPHDRAGAKRRMASARRPACPPEQRMASSSLRVV